MAPEHRRLSRYETMTTDEICALPVADLTEAAGASIPVGAECAAAGRAARDASWGFEYKSNIVWHKVRKDGGSDGRGVGFYFRNVTELLLFGVRGKNARTEAAGPKPGQLHVVAQARALAQAGRAV